MTEQIKVLVVDDEEQIRRNFKVCLEDVGYLVHTAADGEEGLEVFARERSDVVLTDMRMASMNGLKFIDAMHRQSPNTPVVVVSGSATLRDAIEAVRLGAWDYLVKPLQADGELDVTIRRVLERARLMAENRSYLANLEVQVEERTRELRKLNEELERRVQERTAKLEAANEEISTLNEDLLLRSHDLEETNRQLESFSYSVSHDLRAPLRHIRGFTRILLEGSHEKLDEHGKRCLARIDAGCQRMDCLIKDLLNFCQLNLQPLHKTTVHTAPVVRGVLHELICECPEARKINLAIGKLPTCQADPSLLRQVFINLLDNALKYSRQRELPRIEVGSFDRNGETVLFVKDNGTGFNMDSADKLFGVFQRLHRSSEYEGTGVGLAIASNIIQRHGGKIWAEAAEDKGTTFYFTLGSKRP